MTSPPDLARIERCLVRLPGWVGDVVMATPALRALRASLPPGAEIVVEGKAHHRGLVEGLAAVDRYLAAPASGVRATWARARELRTLRFDAAVLLGESERAALGPAIARIPVRVGFARGLARRALLTEPIERPLAADGSPLAFSMIERYLRVTRRLGAVDAGDAMEVPVTDAARASTQARLGAAGVDSAVGLVTLVPGAAQGAAKRWPAERFAAAADRLADERGLHAVVAPGPGEEAIAADVQRAAGRAVTVLAAPPLSLLELAALIERSALVLTNDTGPRSLAVALRTPLVSPVGPTDEAHTRHHLDLQRVLTADVDCRPCHLATCPIDHRCMTRIEVNAVVAAAAELLDADASASRASGPRSDR